MAHRSAPRATPISAIPSKSPDPHRLEARRRDDRHRDPPRHDRGHPRHPRRDREAFRKDVARLVDGVTKLSRSRPNPRMSAPQRTSASSCSRYSTTSACCWSSSPTGCTTCARSTTSRPRKSGGGSRARRWISTRHGRADRHVRDDERDADARVQRARARRLCVDHPAAAAVARAGRRPRQPNRARAAAASRRQRPRSRSNRPPEDLFSIWKKIASGTSASSNCRT